jgi:hypothetical protein
LYRSYRTQREQDIKKSVRGWIFRTAKGIRQEARQLAPKGVSGALRRTIHAYLDYPVSVVTTLMPYAKYVQGYPRVTRRHFHSWEKNYGFRQWARRRGFDTSNPKGGLLTWGYNVPFFTGAIDKMTPRAMMDLRRLHL